MTVKHMVCLFCLVPTVVVAGTVLPIYVANNGLGTVGEYDATTGAAINANFITGLGNPGEILLSGNTLFIGTSAGVGAYNAATGAAINANLISVSGAIFGLVVSGNTLYVGERGNSTVGTYNATTGAAISANFITGSLGFPTRLALSGNHLFVANDPGMPVGAVAKFDATTGAAIDVNFITGLSYFVGLASSGNTLFVSDCTSGVIGEYDATTGAAINANFITGLHLPCTLALLGDVLFVANFGSGTVSEYSATTGAAINTNFITGLSLNGPLGLAVGAPEASVPEPRSTALVWAGALLLAAARRFPKKFHPSSAP